jgi:hypothetical protein
VQLLWRRNRVSLIRGLIQPLLGLFELLYHLRKCIKIARGWVVGIRRFYPIDLGECCLKDYLPFIIIGVFFNTREILCF